MAARVPISERRNSCRFSSVLCSAVLEWLLMLLLFLDALYSYLVMKFARLCKLQTPCLLCSRLDHILGNEKTGFYWNLICKVHKSEISSLAFCHVHQKLADVHDMCEGCLLSFATEKKSNPETYRSLVGKLGMALDGNEDIDLKLPPVTNSDGLQNGLHGDDVAEVPLLKKDPVLLMRTCSCCFNSFRNKPHAVSSLQNKSTGVDPAEFGISLLNAIGRNDLHHQDDLSKTRENSLGPTATYHLGNQHFDRLSHIGYSELKVNSDSESEVPSSDDDDGNTLVHGTEELKQDSDSRCPQPEPVSMISNSLSTTISDDAAPEKSIHPPHLMREPSDSIPEKQLHVSESHDISSLASSIAAGHVLEEVNWSRGDLGADPPLSKVMPQGPQVPSEVSNMKVDILETHDDVHISTSCGEVSKDLSSTEINLKTEQIMGDTGSSLNTHMDLNDAYKLAVGNKDNSTSSNFTEVITGRDSSKVQEDLKLLISQISAAKGLETRWSDMSPSPRVYGQGDEPVLQNITKRLSIERNESGLESLEGSLVSEVEGESTVDRLKRQIELDRKSISLLYKELEEERGASAIAANQAMAMITRLQEEKAAMQMEALQYQRMMEEQAEYDQEALQKSNEVLSQREKEIQDLEAELEIYRNHFSDGSLADRVPEKFDDVVPRENNPSSTTLEKESGISKWSGSGPLKVPLLDFEDEKDYISNCLKKLEKKLHLFSNNGVYIDVSRFDVKQDEYSEKRYEDGHRNVALDHDVKINGEYLEEAVGVNDLEHPHWTNLSQENSQTGGSVLSGNKKPSNSKTSSFVSSQVVQSTTPQNHEDSSDGYRQYLSLVDKECDLATLENEFSHLNERLEALEADHNFLEHTINSLRNGDDGVQFIQEIACHLRELRRIGITRREHSLT